VATVGSAPPPTGGSTSEEDITEGRYNLTQTYSDLNKILILNQK